LYKATTTKQRQQHQKTYNNTKTEATTSKQKQQHQNRGNNTKTEATKPNLTHKHTIIQGNYNKQYKNIIGT